MVIAMSKMESVECGKAHSLKLAHFICMGLSGSNLKTSGYWVGHTFAQHKCSVAVPVVTAEDQVVHSCSSVCYAYSVSLENMALPYTESDH